MQPLPSSRVLILDYLRGIAAICVLLYHAAAILGLEGGSFGYYGVHVFFVLSGFVVPHAMYMRRYNTKSDLAPFLARRLVRLEIPYLSSILFVIVLSYAATLAPGYQGKWSGVSLQDLLGHVAYLNAFTGGQWLNEVYWTLAIELQFYILMAVVFGLLRLAPLSIITALTLWGLQSQNVAILPRWLPLFSCGIFACVMTHQERGWLVRIGGLAVVCFITAVHLGIVAGCVGAIIVLLIWLDPKWLSRALLGAGAISYSLYLTHLPICAKLSNLLGRIEMLSPAMKFAILVLVSISFAVGFYYAIERPSLKLAGRIRYGQARKTAASTVGLSLVPSGTK